MEKTDFDSCQHMHRLDFQLGTAAWAVSIAFVSAWRGVYLDVVWGKGYQGKGCGEHLLQMEQCFLTKSPGFHLRSCQHAHMNLQPAMLLSICMQACAHT